MKKFQRILSSWLAFCLLISMLPIQVFAVEETEATMETTVVTMPEVASETVGETTVEEITASEATANDEITVETTEEIVVEEKLTNTSMRSVEPVVAWAGIGSAADPFLIRTEDDLRSVAESVNGGNTYSGYYFELANDITLTDMWVPIGTAESYFCGTFDGNDYTISGLSATGDYIGLFAYVGNGTVIKNLTLLDVSMTGTYYVAGLVAYVDVSAGIVIISDCNVSGSVYGQSKDEDGDEIGKYAGGIVAYVTANDGSVSFSNCSVSGSVDGHFYVGGIMGYGTSSNTGIEVLSCKNSASIPTGRNSNYCGGIAGEITGASVTSCVNYGCISGNAFSEDNGSSWLGGIAGVAWSCSFTGCGNYGDIQTFFAGGITAKNSECIYIDCINTGALTHSSDGYGNGIGYTYTQNTFENCYSICGTYVTGITAITSEQLSSGEVAYNLGDYFGQNIGVDQKPVRLTDTNQVHCLKVTGDAEYTIYVTHNTNAVWPDEMVDFILKNGENTFNKDSNITQDYNLTAVAAISGTCGDNLSWSFKGTSGVLTIKGTGAMTYYEDSSLPWRDYRSQITTLILPEGLTKISYGAFEELPLTSVIIPDSVSEVGDYAFYNCENLIDVDLGDGCSIGEYAFYHCPVQNLEVGGSNSFGIGSFNSDELTSITITADSASFDNGAFWSCMNLKEVHFTGSAPQYVKDKGIMTESSLASFRDVIWYYDCNQEGWLTSSRYNAINQTWAKYNLVSEKHAEVVDDAVAPTCTKTGLSEGSHCSACNAVIVKQEIVPAKHTYSSDHVCKYCGAIGGTCGQNLDWVLDDEGTLTISGSGSMYGYGYSYHAPWYQYRDLIKSVVIEDGITKIADYSFYFCQQLTKVEIPESVTSIGKGAFSQCAALVDVYITDISKWCTISFGNKYSQISDGDNNASNPMAWADNLYVDGVLATDIRLENGITQISEFAFYNCDTLTSVVIPDSVTSIGRCAFRYCGNLKSVNIPDGVTSIEEETFAGCHNLTSVIIPNSVQYIEDRAFSGCGINSISIPASVISIGEYVFMYNDNSKEIRVASDNNYYSDVNGVLFDKEQTKLIQMPGGFSGSFTIPDTVTEIGSYACYDCYDLTAIEIPDSVVRIGKWAFHDCTGLSEVLVPNGITSIDEGVFDSCSNLLQIIIPESVTSIGDWACYDATSLNKIFIPNSVTTIGEYAFSRCDELASVFYGGNAEDRAAMNIEDYNEGLDNATWYYNSNIPSLCAHIEVIIPAVEATCTETGLTEGKRCSVCGEIIVAQENIEALGHTEKTVVGEAATCTKPGLTDEVSCSVCGEIFTAMTEIPAKGHNEETIPAVAATCTATGLTEGKKCTVCGETTVAQEIIPAGHTIVDGICTVCGASIGTCGDNLTWSFDADTGTLTISGTGEMEYYSSAGYQPWYGFSEEITKVVIEEGVTSVSTNAFRECYSLVSVELPESLTSIDYYAFYECESLKAITIPDGVTYLGGQVFFGCKALSQVKLPAGIKEIPWGFFSGCSSLKTVTIPEKVTKIGSDAFSNCTGLTSATIPNGVIEIEAHAFSECTSLTSITIPDSVTLLGEWAFNSCSKLTSIKLPVNIKKISNGQLHGCISLKSVVIPNKVVKIEDHAFSDCSSLTTVNIPNGVTSIGEYAFSGCSSLTTVNIPEGVTSIDNSVFSYCSSLTDVDLPEGVTSIGEYAFLYCSSLTTVNIPEGITSIGEAAFFYCSSLITVDLPESITSIGNSAFSYCSSLTTVDLPESVTSIGKDAFRNCSSLTTVDISECVTSIGDQAFYGCDNLKTIYFKGNSCNIEEYAFLSVWNATAYYPAGNTTWTEDVMQNYGGEITWKPYCYGEHTVVEDSAVDATCSETGLTTGSHCSACGEVIVAQEIVEKKPHTEETIPAVDATCTETGLTEGKKCTVCGEITIPQKLIAPNGHFEEIIPGVDASCTETGLTEGKKCSVCGEIIVAQETVEAKGHTEETIPAVDATCTETGLTEGKTCTICGEITIPQELTAPNGHSEEIIPAVDATCTETGLTEGKKCSVCGEIIVAQEVIEAKGHTEEIIPSKDATCTETGLTEGKKCTVCGETIVAQETVEALGHTEEIIPGKDATCTATGLTEGKKCTVCGEIIEAQKVIDALGHSEEILPSVDATCTESGLTEGMKCNVCGEILVAQEIVEAKGHTNNVIQMEPTCTESGWVGGYNCAVCGIILQEPEVVPALGHREEVINGWDATCTSEGLTDRKYCSVCQITLVAQEIIPAKGHTEEIIPAVDATCTETGLTEGKKCAVCGEITVAQEVIDAKGHYYENDFDKDCNECGFIRYTTSGTCGENLTWVLDTKTGTLTISGTGYMTDYSDTKDQPWYVFSEKIITVIIENGVAWIGSRAFYDCANLKTVILPETLESIGMAAFCGCTSLVDINIPKTTFIDIGAFSNCRSLTSIDIPDIDTIFEYTFEGCSGLRTITIPKSVKTISMAAFANCTNLSEIRFLGDAPNIWESSPTNNFTNVTATVYYPAGNNTWTADVMKDYGGQLTWVPTCYGQHTVVLIDAVDATCTETGLTEGKKCIVCGEILIAQEVVPATGVHTYENGSCRDCGVVEPTEPTEPEVPETTEPEVMEPEETEPMELKAPKITGSNVASSGKPKLTWSKVEGAVKYEIWRSTKQNSGFTKIYTQKGTTYTNTKAVAGTKYYYKVKAVDADGNVSDFSNRVGRMCDLARPTNLKTTNVAASGKIKLTWKAVDGAKSYKVYRATAKNGKYALVKTVTGTAYTDANAKAGTKYFYKVIAVHENANANSAYSVIVSRMADLARPVITVKRNDAGKPKISWKKVEGAVKYEVWRSTSKNGKYTKIATTKNLYQVNKNAVAGKTYYYKVKAIHSNTNANSAFSTIKYIKAK